MLRIVALRAEPDCSDSGGRIDRFGRVADQVAQHELDRKWLIVKMATLPITWQDWAFVFEVNGEEATKIA